jgi:hypothetical protein
VKLQEIKLNNALQLFSASTGEINGESKMTLFILIHHIFLSRSRFIKIPRAFTRYYCRNEAMQYKVWLRIFFEAIYKVCDAVYKCFIGLLLEVLKHVSKQVAICCQLTAIELKLRSLQMLQKYRLAYNLFQLLLKFLSHYHR